MDFLKLNFLRIPKNFSRKASTFKFQLNLLVLYECIKEIKNQPECHRRVENNCYIKTHIKAVTKKNTKIPAGFSHVLAFSFVSFWHICAICAHNLTDIKTTLVYLPGLPLLAPKIVLINYHTYATPPYWAYLGWLIEEGSIN